MEKRKKELQIKGIPAVLWGAPSRKLYFYVHGQGGCKEEAAVFAEVACRFGWQVLSVDLPKHGERIEGKTAFKPWSIVPELSGLMDFVKSRWREISLYASSIGAWFSMLTFGNETLKNCLFVSPVLDMKELLSKMMEGAGVSKKQLEQQRLIPNDFGEVFSWEYWNYVIEHPIKQWNIPTKILYGEKDNLIEQWCVERFTQKFGCSLTVAEECEHWFHTERQLEVMQHWIRKEIF
jgi:alpha-beta hydrolase superfamily lysophospholipase